MPLPTDVIMSLFSFMQEIYTLTEGHTPKDQHNMLFDKIVRQSSNRILEFEESLQKNLKCITPHNERLAGRKSHGGKRGMNKDDRDQDSDGDGKYVKVAAILPLLDEHTQRLEELENMLSEFKKVIREELGELPKPNGNKKLMGSLLEKFKSSMSNSFAEKEGYTSDPGKISAGNGVLGRWGSKKSQGQQRSSKYPADDLDLGRHEEETDLIDVLKAKARNLFGIDSYSPENAEAASRKRTTRKPSGKINRGYEEEGEEINRRRRRKRKGQGRAVTQYDDNKEESSEYEETEESTIKTWLRQKLQ